MKIAIVSKADSFGGGASRVAEELTQLTNQDGYTVHHYCSWSGKGYNETRRGLYGRFEKIVRGLHFVVKKVGFPEFIPFELPFLLRRMRENQYDLIHFHDLSSAISPFTLMWLSKKVPIIWTLHDCSPFTGGCLYPMDCEKYKEDCRNCPQAGEWPIDSYFDFVYMGRWIKKKLHQNKNIHLITPSQWMADMAMSSNMLKEHPCVLSNGVDIENFKALEKDKLKKGMNLPLDRIIILLSAGNLLDERKGAKYAVEACDKIKDLNPYLIIVGMMDEHAKDIFSEFDYFEAGYLSDDLSLNQHYAAADIFLFCSLADNQPLVILETMASGTPIIGFKTGGIPEMVEDNKTGFLVEQKDIDRLEEVLRETIQKQTYIQWGINARKKAVLEYSYEALLENHKKYYEKVLNESLIKLNNEF